jgi:hypothetical protein
MKNKKRKLKYLKKWFWEYQKILYLLEKIDITREEKESLQIDIQTQIREVINESLKYNILLWNKNI